MEAFPYVSKDVSNDISCSITWFPVRSAASSPIGLELGAVARTRTASAKPTGGDYTTHRHHRHHHRLSPAADQRSQGLGRLGSLRPSLARGSKHQHHHHLQRSGPDRRQAARQGNLRPAHDPKRRRVDNYFLEEFHFVGCLHLRRKRRRAPSESEAPTCGYAQRTNLRLRSIEAGFSSG